MIIIDHDKVTRSRWEVGGIGVESGILINNSPRNAVAGERRPENVVASIALLPLIGMDLLYCLRGSLFLPWISDNSVGSS